uniref:Uncharacterized protein n=1 Tax=Arundo donax TaxID=35708 RepID=A0A0A9FGH4_ARUDO
MDWLVRERHRGKRKRWPGSDRPRQCRDWVPCPFTQVTPLCLDLVICPLETEKK